jgi:sulfoxide reductase heme-binding subunit YedZ
MTKTHWPWRDRTGRFSWLKAAVLLCEVAPGAWIGYALLTGALGARPNTEAIHQTGLWALRFLLLSLMVSPARAIFNWHRIMLVRRQLGITALFYALAHVVLYARDQNWVLPHVASEILERFYLEIGFVALTGLAVLGVTSTDRALRRLGHGWKRLHRTVYALAVLALFHFFLQSKANVAEATLMAGLFVWMMGWRLLPSGPDRAPLPILGLAVATGLVTAGLEAAWYGLATAIGPRRPLAAELDVAYGPHPAGQVVLVCLCFAIATALFWAQHRERMRQSPLFQMALYGGGGVIVVLLAFSFSLTDDWLPDDWSFWQAAAGFVLATAVLGLVRWLLPARLAYGRRALDVICVLGLLLPLAAGLTL